MTLETADGYIYTTFFNMSYFNSTSIVFKFDLVLDRIGIMISKGCMQVFEMSVSASLLLGHTWQLLTCIVQFELLRKTRPNAWLLPKSRALNAGASRARCITGALDQGQRNPNHSNTNQMFLPAS